MCHILPLSNSSLNYGYNIYCLSVPVQSGAWLSLPTILKIHPSIQVSTPTDTRSKPISSNGVLEIFLSNSSKHSPLSDHLHSGSELCILSHLQRDYLTLGAIAIHGLTGFFRHQLPEVILLAFPHFYARHQNRPYEFQPS